MSKLKYSGSARAPDGSGVNRLPTTADAWDRGIPASVARLLKAETMFGEMSMPVVVVTYGPRA